jgi:protein-tyrosine-phosphatase
MSVPKFLFLCTGNSAHSQMGEAFLRAYANENFDVFSAGLEPKGEILPGEKCPPKSGRISITLQSSKIFRSSL